MSYVELTQNITKSLMDVHAGELDVMKGFGLLSSSAMKGGAIDAKTKELIALAIGVANRCDGCIGFHVKALVKMGMTAEELHELMTVAVYMGGGPSLMYAANIIAAYKEFTEAA